MRQIIKPVAQRLGIDGGLRQLSVEAGRIGERLKFGLLGRPSINSTLLLAGSGRSGTTWLADVICSARGVQPIFEPLFPLWNARVRDLTGWDMQNPYFRAIYLRPGVQHPIWRDVLAEALSGKHRNYWTDYQRTSYFPDRFLVKEVRANMMLGFIYDNFQPQIVYMLRHPCAVVYSRISIQKPWYATVADLLAQDELVENYLRPWVGKIENVNSLVEAHAVWWAVENRVALKELKTRSHIRINYEELLVDPQGKAMDVLSRLGLSADAGKTKKMLEQSSRMTRADRLVTKQDRLEGWRKGLSREDQKLVLTWAERFGIGIYNEKVSPEQDAESC